jgi:acyl-CoA hydrolase
MCVYVQGVSGESALIGAALRAQPDAAAGVTFTGVWLPGINRLDYAGLDPRARAEAFFITPDLHPSFRAGRVAYRPLSYLETYRYLQRGPPIDLALLQVSPPDRQGRVSLGVANDFTPALLGRARQRLAHINPLMPQTRGAATFAHAELDWVVEAPSPLLSDDGGEDAAWTAIGRHVATLVADGATIEIGIGRVPQVLHALTGHRNLRVHSGAVTSPLLALDTAGALAREADAVIAGVALGSEALHAFVATDPRVRFAPVVWTHDMATLSRIERFVAINGVIEVDLWGQANAEMVDGRHVSSAGGIGDFIRGARAAPGGLAIIALPATARDGRVSRIVPQLADTVVSVGRTDVDVVVTEHGVARLRHASIDERAEALIAIAAPAFRDELAAAWSARRKRA